MLFLVKKKITDIWYPVSNLKQKKVAEGGTLPPLKGGV